ncbi:PAS domain S-box protein [Fibrisoma montanum]|uniref:Sensory/regulatory protein RpfC n=1 Tax=Fibrisoma montanum TaxID=2305895 RepID=A0A418LXY5_9BACT|nr:PAS domain S-box protein [Fibrisoma montanum]RIV18134.1 PAS domain S-box protein [Fibrisoma montanum]
MRWSAKTKDELIAEINRLHTLTDGTSNLTDGLHPPTFDVRPTVDQLNLVGLTIDRDGTLSYVNPYTYRVTAWLPDEIVGKNFFDIFIPAADRARLEQDFDEALDRGSFTEQREITLLARSGAVRNVQLNSFIPHVDNGEVSSFTIIGEDVTNKKRVASALSYTNAQLQDLVDNTSDLIQLLTLDGKFIFVNRAWREALNYSSEEIAALNLRDVLHPDYVDTTLAMLKRIQEGGQLPYFETVFRTKSGRTIFLSGSVNCRFDRGRPTAFRCILHDTTAKIRAEKSQKLYYSIANWMINTPNLDEFYHKIHEELGNIIEARNFFIALYDQSKTYLYFPYYVDEYFGGNMRFTKRKLGNGLTEYTIRANKPLFLYEKDIRQMAEQHTIDLYGQLQPKVMLTAPLRIGDEITGIIGVKSYDNALTYGPRDLELLEFISGQVALAIARKQSEVALDKQNARLNAIFDSSTYLIWSVNKALQLTSFNRNYTRLIESQLGEVPTLHVSTPKLGWRMIGEDNRRLLEEKYRQAFRGVPQNFELYFETKKGEVWLEFHLNPILLAGGVIEEVSGIARDITNRKRAEIATRQSEEKFRGIFENLQDIYARVDRKGRLTMISPSVFKRMGYTPEEVLGQDITQFFVDKSVIHRAMIKLGRNRSLRNFEATMRRKDGTERQFMFNMLLLKDEQGTYSVVAALARDITELKRQASELVKARDEAERSLKVKERFLANMSHEIRTPMNGVIGMIDLLTDTKLDDEQREYVRTIKRSSETLLNILNDILDLSKIEAGKMVLHEAPVALKEVFEKLIALFGQQAASKNNRLTYHLADDLPTFVIADQTRLLQILSNLTSNAIKFTENGSVDVDVSLVSKRGKFNRIRVEVRDTGIGISPENINLLFNSFSQVDTSSRKSFGGTGLGLAISKELAHLMKGEVGVESEVGQGSTFWFVIELKETAISPTQQTTEAAEVTLANFFSEYHPQVLLVDDNAVNRKVASEILRKAGCIVTTAASGPEAIASVAQGAGGEGHGVTAAKETPAPDTPRTTPFDVIFMDIQMPDMDGVETTHHLREQFKQLPPIVAMTAYSMREDRERFLSQGLDDYIAKPIRAQSLIAKVKELVDAGQSKRASTELARRQKRVAEEAALPVIDQEIVGQLHDIGGQDLVDSVFDEFVTEATELVSGAKDAFALGDIPTVKSHLHTLKGSAGTIGVARVAFIAREAEGKLKVNDTGTLGEELKQLDKAFTEFLDTYATVRK